MRNVAILILTLVLFSSCKEELIEYTPTEKFNSIFDDPKEGASYTPLDVIETDDGGFLVLAELANNQVFVLKVSSRGEFLWSQELESKFVRAVGNIVRQGQNYYFIASSLPDYTAVLFEINDLEQTIAELRTYTAYRRPLAFSNLTPDTYLLMTYNDTTGTVLSKLQDGFAMEWARKYDTIRNAHEKLEAFENFSRADFFVGSYNAGAVIYFNSLRAGGFDLTYANNLGIETGTVSSSERNSISSLTPYGNSLLAANYSVNNQSYFINNYKLGVNGSTAVEELAGVILQDRLPMNKAGSAIVPVGTAQYLVNAYTTIDGRIKLEFYDVITGAKLAWKYMGGIDPLEVVKIIPTEDQGMVILSKITLAGANKRINLVKFPKAEILDIL